MQRTHDWAVRCLAEHRRLTAARHDKPHQALFGVVQGAQYEDLRRQAARGLTEIVDDDGRRLRRLRHRRGAGEAEPRHHRRLGHRRAARRQAAPPARHQRTRRPVRRHRRGRGHLRLRVAVPGGPQRRGVLGDRPLQHHRRQVPAGLHADRRRMRLLHLRQLHPRLHPPPVQGEGDAGLDAVHDSQRALRDSTRRPDPRSRSSLGSSTSSVSTCSGATTVVATFLHACTIRG